MGILTAVAAPTFFDSLLFHRVESAARRVKADLELAQLYLACWSPERARAQRFRQQLDDYTTLAVRASASSAVA